MSGSALLRVVRRSLPLPSLKQGTTLSIRSQIPQISLRIQSGWRDDGAATLQQSFRGGEQSAATVDMLVAHEKDQVTSLGRSESHLSISLVENTTQKNQTYTLLDSLEDDNDESNPLSAQEGEAQIQAWLGSSSEGGDGHSTEVTLEVPEKVNLICELDQGGSIDISSKIEGDVKLRTTNGNIRVKKLRGHTIDLETSGGENYIHSSDLLEAQQLKLNLLEGGRLRAKRIHGDTVDIRVTAPTQQHTAADGKVDDDDEGALVDISSMYVSGTGGAHVALEGPLRPLKRGVRIKSHHGPVLVNAIGVYPPVTDGQPLVELGSVNGSCEVAIVDSPTEQSKDDDDWVACQVHYDSISPESVSLISTQTGNVALTFDRKMEADLRLLSTGGSTSEAATTYLDDMAAVLADEDDSNEVAKALGGSSASGQSDNSEKEPSRISITTKSFTKSQFYSFPSPVDTISQQTIEYMEGWVENKSHEPDSRFEMKTRGEEGLGKIRLDDAANQALKSFSSPSLSSPEEQSTTDGSSSSMTNAARPLIVAATGGRITVESLSWLGAIARRYGFDEKGKDLGRQATRRGRVVLPADE